MIQWLSNADLRVLQPIGALFAWIEEKTGIECSSKVRSYNGIMMYLFGKLAAALLLELIAGLALNSHLRA